MQGIENGRDYTDGPIDISGKQSLRKFAHVHML